MVFRKLKYKEGLKLIAVVPNQRESTIYQSKQFLEFYHKSQYFRFIGLRPEFNFFHKDFFFVAGTEGKQLQCLMACEVDKRTHTLGIMGDRKQLNIVYYDADVFSYEMLSGLIEYLQTINGVKRIFFQNLDKETLFYQHLKRYCLEHDFLNILENSTECVRVRIEENNYDTWFSGLSKSVRQNIRTAYNHFKTDNKEYEVRHYVPAMGGADYGLFLREMYLQRRRNLEKRGKQFKGANKILCRIGLYLSMINPRTQMLMKSEKSYICELWIEGQLAAFVGGYFSDNGRFFIPFLKYNMDFKRYSPGGVVINESIKYLCQSDYNLKYYDLLTGDEPYKFSYGGEKYDNANISIEL